MTSIAPTRSQSHGRLWDHSYHCHPKHPRHFLDLWLRHRAHATITRFRRFRSSRQAPPEITTLILVLVVRLVSRKVSDGRWPRKNSASRRVVRLVTAFLSPCARWRGRDYASDCGAVIGQDVTQGGRILGRSPLRADWSCRVGGNARRPAAAQANSGRDIGKPRDFSKAHERRSRSPAAPSTPIRARRRAPSMFLLGVE